MNNQEKFIIMQVECHPDRCIGSFFGPYNSRQEAEEIAIRMDNDPRNFNKNCYRIYWHDVHPLEKI